MEEPPPPVRITLVGHTSLALTITSGSALWPNNVWILHGAPEELCLVSVAAVEELELQFSSFLQNRKPTIST